MVLSPHLPEKCLAYYSVISAIIQAIRHKMELSARNYKYMESDLLVAPLRRVSVRDVGRPA
jgi:hypothetical protein